MQCSKHWLCVSYRIISIVEQEFFNKELVIVNMIYIIWDSYQISRIACLVLTSSFSFVENYVLTNKYQWVYNRGNSWKFNSNHSTLAMFMSAPKFLTILCPPSKYVNEAHDFILIWNKCKIVENIQRVLIFNLYSTPSKYVIIKAKVRKWIRS